MKAFRVVGLSLLGVGILSVAVLVAPVVRATVRQRADVRRSVMIADGAGSEIGAAVHDAGQADLDRAKSPGGAVVDDVRPDSPAAMAGFKSGDLVVEFDGERVRSAAQLTRLVRETPAERAVKAVVVRDGNRVDLTVTPRERRPGRWSDDAFERPFSRLDHLPDLNVEIEKAIGPMFGGRGRLGITVEELTPQLGEYFGAKQGLLITSVQEDDSPAAKAGLKAGDILTTVNQQTVTVRGDVMEALHEMDDGAEVTLGIVRDRKPMTLKATLTGEPGRGRRVYRNRGL
jgi:serine protease Do